MPSDPEALDGLVILFEKAGRWRPLIDVLARRGKLDRPQGEQRADRVRVATILSEKLEATDEAIETWRDVEATFGESDEGTRALAALFRSTRLWAELADLLAGAAARNDDASEKANILRELGDVQREQLDAVLEAIASYEAALSHDPRSEGSRVGLRSLLKRSEHRPDVVRVLLAAYNAADDWRLVLDLTEHRLNAAKETSAQIAILMEAARISETRAQDTEAAFALVRRALLLDPGDEANATIEEIFRLAELTRSFRSLADALREAIDSDAGQIQDSRTGWARALRFRMGGVLETRLDELRAALDAYVQVARDEPSDLEAARAVIRVAGRTMRWDAAAQAIVETTRAREALEPALVEGVEEAASAASGWDAITFALAALVHEGGGLLPSLARDIEAAIAVWHRDRRGDPDAAEAAYARAPRPRRRQRRHARRADEAAAPRQGAPARRQPAPPLAGDRRRSRSPHRGRGCGGGERRRPRALQVDPRPPAPPRHRALEQRCRTPRRRHRLVRLAGGAVHVRRSRDRRAREDLRGRR